MDETEPSCIGFPIAESTMAIWAEPPVLQVSLSLHLYILIYI